MPNWGRHSREDAHDQASLRVLRSLPGALQDLTNALVEPLINRRKEHLPALFQTPDHRIRASIEHISVAFGGGLIQRFTIQRRAIDVKTFVPDTDRPLLPIPNKERALHP